MDKTNTITATELRKNLYRLLNQVFSEDKTLIVIKSGIAVAKIMTANERRKELHEISVEDALRVLNTPIAKR